MKTKSLVFVCVLFPFLAVQADEKPRLSLQHQINVIAVAFPKNKKELITIGTQSDVRVKRWNLKDGKLLANVQLQTKTHGNHILMSGSAISPDGMLFCANEKEGLAIWSTYTGEKLAMLKTDRNIKIGAVNFSEDSKLIVGCEAAGFSGLRFDLNGYHWNISEVHNFVQMSDQTLNNKDKFVINAEQGYLFPKALQIHHAAISKSAKRIALASQENGTALYDLETGERLKIISNDNGKKKHPKIEKMAPSVANQVLSVSFSPNGTYLAITDMFGAKIRKVSDGSLIHDIEKPFRYGRSRTVFSSDNKYLLRYQTDKLIVVWDVVTGKQVTAFNTEAQSATFSRDSNQIGVGFSDRKTGISVYDLTK